jgi:hypothetical protein
MQYSHNNHHTIYTRDDEIDDEAAKSFTIFFYEMLLTEGYSIGQSFTLALQEVGKHFSGEKEKFVLLPRNQQSHHDKKSITAPPGEFFNESPKVPIGNLLRHCPDMMGRQEIVCEVYDKLHRHDEYEVISIFGEEGIGKTQVHCICVLYGPWVACEIVLCEFRVICALRTV